MNCDRNHPLLPRHYYNLYFNLYFIPVTQHRVIGSNLKWVFCEKLWFWYRLEGEDLWILTCSVGPVGQGPWRLMSATKLRRSDGAVAGPRRIGLPRPRNVKVHVNSHPFVLTLLSAEGLRTFLSHQMLFRPNSSRNVLYYWLVHWSARCIDEC